MSEIMNRDFFESIRTILHNARKKAYSRVNFIMVEAYWKIGQRIVEEEQGGLTKAVYGEGLLKSLSRKLTAEFGRGFSYANLRNFRQFYLTYSDFEKCYTLCSKLSWSYNRLISGKNMMPCVILIPVKLLNKFGACVNRNEKRCFERRMVFL
jgi:hypothetical protein